MNIHHLELFYYVARHGGISAAVRRMPYGIQQPALSSQILILERNLGVKLFQRRPFRLTSEGQELLAFIRPFFDNLDAVSVRLRKRIAPQLRIGAAELVLREHLPAVIQRLKQKHPGIRLGLRSGFQPEIEAWLQERQVDFAVIPCHAKPLPGITAVSLLEIPLVLLVPKASAYLRAEKLWPDKRPAEPLIGLPSTESISALFQRGLEARGIEWPIALEASSMTLITQYVANGDGVGISIAVPDLVQHPAVRVLPLEGFDPLRVAAMWQGRLTPLVSDLLEEVQRYVRETWPEASCGSVKKKSGRKGRSQKSPGKALNPSSSDAASRRHRWG